MKHVCLSLTLFFFLLLLVLGLSAAIEAYTADVAQKLRASLDETSPAEFSDRTVKAAREICRTLDEEEEKLAYFLRSDTVNRLRTSAEIFLDAVRAKDPAAYSRARRELSDAVGNLERAGRLSPELFL